MGSKIERNAEGIAVRALMGSGVDNKVFKGKRGMDSILFGFMRRWWSW